MNNDKKNIQDIDTIWDKSVTKKIVLSIFIYFSVAIYTTVLNIVNSWAYALIPAFIMLILQLTLPYFRSLWLKYIYNKFKITVN